VASRRLHRSVLSAVAATAAVVVAGTLLPGAAAADPKPTIAQVESRVEALNHQAEQAAERYNDARVELDKVAKDLATLKNRVAAQEKKVASAQDAVDAFAVATYRSGGVDPTVQLLLSQDPDAFLRQASSLTEVSRQQAQALDEVLTARQRMAQDKLAVAQKLGQQKATESKLAAEKKQVQAKLAEAQRLLSTLKAEERARIARAQEAARQKALADARKAAARERAAARASRSSSGGRPSAKSSGGYTGPASGRAATAVKFAYAQLGEPYVWGAAGPSSWDCSGLTMMAWRAAGVSLPHSAAMQARSAPHVSRSALRPGDLVFFYSPISHVGIYIGGGRIIDAPHPGASVRITSLSRMPFAGAVRP
jgi:cell wall-associated NlpC family hydrolase